MNLYQKLERRLEVTSETQDDTLPLGTISDFGFSEKKIRMGDKHVIGKMCATTLQLDG